MPLKHLAHYTKLSLRMLICSLLPKGWYIRSVCCQCCSMEESVGISGLCVVSAALWRRVLVYQACVLSVLLYGGECWYIRSVCCQCCSMEESVGISGLCVVSAALWRRVLDAFEKAKGEHLPPSLHPHHLRDYLHITMGGAYFLQDDERAVGRRGDHNN